MVCSGCILVCGCDMFSSEIFSVETRISFTFTIGNGTLKWVKIEILRQELSREYFGIFKVKLVRTCYLDMAERLQAVLAPTRLELQQLKERMETGAVAVHKDLSLVSLIPKWSGTDSTISPEEFFLALSPRLKLQTGNKQTNYRSPF